MVNYSIEELRYDFSGHLNEKGHGVAAEIIFNEMNKFFLTPENFALS